MDIEIIEYPLRYLDIIFMAGRSCYGIEDFNHDISYLEESKFAKMLIQKYHESVIEHISITAYCKNMSRSFMSQITRHRLASFSIKSQHFCDHSNFKYKLLESDVMCTEYIRLMAAINDFYVKAVTNGMPKYIAREVLPNSALTNIFMTANAREWRHIIAQRITSDNTPEIKEWAEKILLILASYMPELFSDLVEKYVRF